MQTETINQIYPFVTVLGAGLITFTSALIGQRKLIPAIGLVMVGKTFVDIIATSGELLVLSANVLSMLGLCWSIKLTENNNLTNQE